MQLMCIGGGKMSIYNKSDIKHILSTEELVITPLLEEDQIQEASIDLRLGNVFKIEKQVRDPYIDIKRNDIEKFFDTTYRDFGEEFILYPNQLVLATSFEYLKVPKNAVGNVITRSSINRLGISLMSIVQPGYVGTLTLELVNKTNTAINLMVGMRFVQLQLLSTDNMNIAYVNQPESKYVGNIEPKISTIYKDRDLEILKKIKG